MKYIKCPKCNIRTTEKLDKCPICEDRRRREDIAKIPSVKKAREYNRVYNKKYKDEKKRQKKLD